MLKKLKRLAYAGMFLLPLAAAPLRAQDTTVTTTPSLEGTTIKNVATASYTDANNNTYTAARDSVSVLVGFFAAPNPTGATSATPASPSTGNIATFTLRNSGNGIDSATVGFSTDSGGLTITKYTYNGISYSTLDSLNNVIKLVSLAPNGSLNVSVTYNVGGTVGGKTLPLKIRQYSVRTPATSYTHTTLLTPPLAFSVQVTPDLGTTSNLVSNGAAPYTYTFTVKNTGNASDTYAISAAVAGPSNGTVVITGTSVSSLQINAGATKTFTVSYRVLAGTAPDKINVTAAGSATDYGDVTVSIRKAALTLAKTAHKTIGGAVLDTTAANAVVPGTAFYYKLAVTNGSAAADAKSVVITDALPGAVSYESATGDVPADWTITESAGTITATLNADITAGSTRYIWVKVQIKTTPATVLP